MGTCREACAQLFRRGVAAGLFGAILCFATVAASPQESTKASTKASAKASAQAPTKASTKASAQAATKASAQTSTKAPAQAATKASAQAAAKASTHAAAKASPRSSASPQASAKASAKAPAHAAAKASAQAAAKTSTHAAVKASAQESEKVSAKASAKASPKESPQDASAQQPLKLSGSQLEPVKWSELPRRAQAAARRSRGDLRSPVERLPQRHGSAATGLGYRARLLRTELSTRSHRAPGRGRRAADRLFRAGRRGLALSQSRIPRPGLPPAA